jgi:5-methylcytosine-specific restriction protein A
MFILDSYYTRKAVWDALNPDQEFPKGGSWHAEYVVHGTSLMIFASIGGAGRDEHVRQNQYNYQSKELEWFGKPNAHSEQPTFKNLFEGATRPHVFVNWDSKDTKFLYLGVPTISSFKDGIETGGSARTINIAFKWALDRINPPPEGFITSGIEGQRGLALVNRYERDPALRASCISYFGARCQVCDFDFESVYGDLGKDFCHVHHITSLSEMGGSTTVNPTTDLIPLCANCHSMIHRAPTLLHPNELRAKMDMLKRPRTL